jgi:hypothetical protein
MTSVASPVGITFVVLGAVLSVACSTTAEPPAGKESTAPATPWFQELKPLAVPVNGSAMAPHLSASANGITLSWVTLDGANASLQYAHRDGDAWSPVSTAASGKNWFLSAADVPSVRRLSNGTLVANWFVGTKPELEAYDLLLSYSTDQGRTWAKPFTPHHDGTETQHGFSSLFEMPDHGLGLVWLDGRDQSNNTTDPEGGVMALRFTRFDDRWKQGADTLVNMRVCECCQTGAALTTEGIITAFRDRSDKEIRDIAVSRLDNGAWTPAAVVHADHYESLSCPVNGPAISARDKIVAVAWYTVQKDIGHTFAAFSSDAGRSWSAPIRLDVNQSLGLVDIELLDDGTAAASWVEFANDKRRFMVRRVEPNGHASAPTPVGGQEQGRLSGYPRMARVKDGLIFAWIESAASDPVGDGAGSVKAAFARIAN